MRVLAIPNEIVYLLGAALLLALVIIFVFALAFYRIASGKAEATASAEPKEAEPETPAFALPEVQKFSLADITDEDMLVAALIAAVDFAEETKKDVRLVSIRQI